MSSVDSLYIHQSALIKDALDQLENTSVGLLLLVTEENKFERTITDGDIRRLILAGQTLQSPITSLPSIQSATIHQNQTRREALDLMNQLSIDHLPILNEAGYVIGLLNRKDIDRQILLSTPHIGDTEREYVEEAFQTNWIAPLGPNVNAFEQELANMVDSSHAAAVSSGTAAIHLGLRLLGVDQGDRVFCSDLTFAASAFPIKYLNATPIFIDSELQSWNMCPKALERAFETAKSENWLPKAVIVVNIFGQSADIDPILEICNYYNTPVLEDAAESLGSKYKGQYSGTLGTLGVYSFNGNKIITTSGGGMLVSNNGEIIDKAKFLATQARNSLPYYEHSEVGYNYRMSNILAGVGRGQLKVLEERVEARRKVFQIYKTELADIPVIEWMPEPEWSYSNRWLTVGLIRSDSKIDNKNLIKKLADDFIEARYVWKPMHLQPIFLNNRYFSSNKDSVSDFLFTNGFCLPSGSNLSESDQSRVIEHMKKVFR